MTWLRMYDGPVENCPNDGDAYAGYVDNSGIGETYDKMVAAHPGKKVLSIATMVGFKADCGDVESGALSSWAGFVVGYCSVSRVNQLIAEFGRPKKLWTAHDDPAIGAHVCSASCWPGLVTTADGTQWGQGKAGNGGSYDISWLAEDFFNWQQPQPQPQPQPAPLPVPTNRRKGMYVYAVGASTDKAQTVKKGTQWVIEGGRRWQVFDVASVREWFGRGPVAFSGNQIAHIPVA